MNRHVSADKTQMANLALIIDNQPIFGQALKTILPHTQICLLNDAEISLKKIRLLCYLLKPDLILLGLKHEQNIDILQSLKTFHESSIMLILNHGEDKSIVKETLNAGADGFISRHVKEEDLKNKISFLYNQKLLVQQSLILDSANTLLYANLYNLDYESPLNLTNKERDVLRVLATGKCNKLIGRELGLAESTVKVHLKRLYKKLKCKNRSEAIRYFFQFHHS